MKLEELVVHLRIEEDNRNSEKKGKNLRVAKANVVEHGETSNSKKWKHTGQGLSKDRKVVGTGRLSSKANASSVTR